MNGKPQEGTSGRFGDIFDPAKGELTARVPFAGADEVRAAVASAKAAQPAWAAVPAVRRARVMFKLKELIERHMDDLARIVTSEHGKTVEDAKGSITRGLEVVEFACGIPHLLKGDYTQNVGHQRGQLLHAPAARRMRRHYAVQLPAMIPLWMFPLSIACGNAFVLKPSEKDPSLPLRLAELALEAGLPEGVLNVVNGNKEAVDALLADPDVASISFVGSTPIAEYIYATGAAQGKRVQALGGAKNHMIVMPDADLDQATDALIGAAYGSAGERCMAVSVLVAVDPVGDAMIERLTPRMESIKVGPGIDPSVEMGPLVSRAHLEKVRGYVDAGVAEGAKLVVDGRDLSLQGYENGYFMGPCLFDEVKPEMSIYKEEIFGPVLSVVRAPDYESALALVDDHEFGNGTSDLHPRRRRSARLREPGQNRHGGCQRADPGADGVSHLRRLEALAVR